MKTTRCAFTLIELLVVIVIIGVLAGVALPVFQKIQENGRTLQCASNLRQIGLGLLAFAADHNQMCPVAGGDTPYHGYDAYTRLPGWTEQLEPYAGTDRDLYTCPSSSKAIPANAQYSYFAGTRAAYVAAGQNPAALWLPHIVSPAKYILGGDISSAKLFTATDADKNDNVKNPAFAVAPAPFHGGRVNLVFADGHCGSFAAFDPNAMDTQYNLQPDGTGYPYY